MILNWDDKTVKNLSYAGHFLKTKNTLSKKSRKIKTEVTELTLNLSGLHTLKRAKLLA